MGIVFFKKKRWNGLTRLEGKNKNLLFLPKNNVCKSTVLGEKLKSRFFYCFFRESMEVGLHIV